MPISYVLSSYQQNFDDPHSIDVVRTTVRVYDAGVPVGGRDVALSNAALLARAEEGGRKTWDERDVALALGEKLGASVYIAEPAPRQPVEPDLPTPVIVVALPEPTVAPWYTRMARRLGLR